MGETIRKSMVAVVTFFGLSATHCLHAQNSGGSLADAIAGAADKIAGSVSSTAENARRSTSTPNFTSGFDPQPVGRRAGGPSTDPAKRDNGTWLSPEAAARGSRPTTNPYSRNVSTKTPASIDNTIAMQPSQIATVGATEDPNSAEAQLRARANRNSLTQPTSPINTSSINTTPGNTSAGSAAPATSTGSATGFAKSPGGISFPNSLMTNPQSPQGDSGAAARFAAATSPGADQTSATGANEFNANSFNPSASSQNTASTGPSSMMGMPGTTAKPNGTTTGIGFSGAGFSGLGSSGLGSSGLGSSGLGNPNPNSGSAASSQSNSFNVPGSLNVPGQPNNSALANSWTVEQVRELGRRFGIPANDDRLANPVFVNQLHEKWLAHLAKESATNTATGQLGGNHSTHGSNTSLGQLSANGYAASGQNTGSLTPGSSAAGNPMAGWPTNATPNHANNGSSQLNLPGFTAPQQPANPYGQQNDPARIAAASNQPAAADHSAKRFYDRYGNVIDIHGNVYENGQIVDEARKYELTAGRKIREDMEKILQEREKLDRERREQLARNNSSDVRSPSDSLANGAESGAANGSRLESNGRSSAEFAKSANGKPIAIDQAGIGGSTKTIGSSNPYVNVFLLCSLVANIFLFVWLHKLWYHHRDLIASSRMASSGISTNE